MNKRREEEEEWIRVKDKKRKSEKNNKGERGIARSVTVMGKPIST